MSAYYNEIDPFAADWLENLIAAGHIAPGVVDRRSIEDVRPDDLREFDQCHFFAGLGGWSLALRLARFPDDGQVWTGSCPCQPFSAAGKRGGTADERHLWPALFHQIEHVRPPVFLGEQVASRDGLDWLDLVHADLEGAGYDVAAADLCAAGVGAPHIRQRLWFVADADGRKPWQAGGLQPGGQYGQQPTDGVVGRAGGELGHARGSGLSARERDALLGAGWREEGGAAQQPGRASGGVGHPGGEGGGRDARAVPGSQGEGAGERRGVGGQPHQPFDAGAAYRHNGGPALTFWSDCDWIPCRDGKARPVEPGTFPLAHGVPGRVGRLRAYGNAIVPQAAAAFIQAAIPFRLGVFA